MEKTRPILYGVADYAEIRKANAWFVDRIAKIRDLEATLGEEALSSFHNGTVALHRLVLVFHGGDCVLSEEVRWGYGIISTSFPRGAVK